MKFFRNHKFLLGLLFASVLFLFCSYTYRVNNNDVDVRTVYEDGHKYVVATMTNKTNSSVGSVSIVHSENCPCKK